MDDEETLPTPKPLTTVAAEIDNLCASIKRTQEKRDPLPQPLFWSAFAHKIEAIRKKKALHASLREIFD